LNMRTNARTRRIIKDRLDRTCAACAKAMRVILYTDKNYRGGHYFGKIPVALITLEEPIFGTVLTSPLLAKTFRVMWRAMHRSLS